MKIRTQMLIILVIGVALTILVQAVASPKDTLLIGRLLMFEAIFGLPFAILIYRAYANSRP